LPFAAWAYRPAYLPDSLCLYIAASTSPQQPLLFYFPLCRRAEQPPPWLEQARRHPLGLRAVTRVLLSGPCPRAADLPGLPGAIVCQTAENHLMEIGFDGESAGGGADLRPFLPLVLRW
jgi:hypothetical protein